MDDDRFDALSRTLSIAPSRRSLLRLLAGGALGGLRGALDTAETAAKRCKKRCGRCQTCNRRRGRCRPKRDRTACGNDGTRQCCDGRCCDRGDICVKGKCVTGQGTCADGEDFCTTGGSCNGAEGSECLCLQTTSGATRCAEDARIGDCGECEDDAFCRNTYGPEAFCVDIGHGRCGCKEPGKSNWCARPCPF